LSHVNKLEEFKRGVGMNILIAEDCSIIQMINEELMKDWGYNFDMASNGVEAVEFARANNGKYDLCLMDVDMPKMNGIEATKIIRKITNYFPILAMTANDSYKKGCFEAGMDGFAVKPCLPDDLFAKINELSVKLYQLITKPNGFGVKEVMPVDSDELKELKELKKKGLTKLKLVGLGHAFVVHKNIQNKISHDLIKEGKDLSEFIDRSPTEPGRCHLYKANLHVTKDLFMPDELEEAIRKEDEIALKFNESSDKYHPDE